MGESQGRFAPTLSEAAYWPAGRNRVMLPENALADATYCPVQKSEHE